MASAAIKVRARKDRLRITICRKRIVVPAIIAVIPNSQIEGSTEKTAGSYFFDQPSGIGSKQTKAICSVKTARE